VKPAEVGEFGEFGDFGDFGDIYIYFFRVRMDAAQRPRGQQRGGRERGEGRERGGEGEGRGGRCVRADACASAPCFIPGIFKKDATVHPSHGRPRGHRPIVRPKTSA
jgi:hypothetical protein